MNATPSADASAVEDSVAIRTSGLTKRYGKDVLAVADLDLTVYEGKIFGFLGPNGAGKSTTIDVVMDYVRPTAGSATVLGFDAQDDTREIHERVGILPDGYGLYDRLTGRKHLEYAIALKGADDDPETLLDCVGLDVSAADLLILDEPSSGLDPNGVRLLVTGEMPGQVVPAWLLLLQGLSPSGAYNALAQTLLLGSQTAVQARIGGPTPAYLHPGVFLAIMVAWAALPLLVGYLGFRRADLS